MKYTARVNYTSTRVFLKYTPPSWTHRIKIRVKSLVLTSAPPQSHVQCVRNIASGAMQGPSEEEGGCGRWGVAQRSGKREGDSQFRLIEQAEDNADTIVRPKAMRTNLFHFC